MGLFATVLIGFEFHTPLVATANERVIGLRHRRFSATDAAFLFRRLTALFVLALDHISSKRLLHPSIYMSATGETTTFAVRIEYGRNRSRDVGCGSGRYSSRRTHHSGLAGRLEI